MLDCQPETCQDGQRIEPDVLGVGVGSRGGHPGSLTGVIARSGSQTMPTIQGIQSVVLNGPLICECVGIRGGRSWIEGRRGELG